MFSEDCGASTKEYVRRLGDIRETADFEIIAMELAGKQTGRLYRLNYL